MLSLIGKTPIIKLKNTINNHNLYAKCEWLNPTGSIKDRVAKYILENLIKTKNKTSTSNYRSKFRQYGNIFSCNW